MLFVNFQIRLKDFKNIYLYRQLNYVIINSFFALLEVTIMYNIYIDNMYNLIIHLYCNLDRIVTTYYIIIKKTYPNGYQRKKWLVLLSILNFTKYSGNISIIWHHAYILILEVVCILTFGYWLTTTIYNEGTFVTNLKQTKLILSNMNK